VTGINTIKADDTFLAVGGDSIAGALLINRLRTDFKVEMSFPTLFETKSTLAAIAKMIDKVEAVSGR
jgi:hypothetical protein